jgi:hypothetical protein
MPISITIDTSAVEKRLADMSEKLNTLTQEIPTEFYNWQAEDMHRKQPRQKVWRRGKSVSTIIRPHSYAEMKRSQHAQARARRRRHSHLQARWSTRPILRAELLTRLQERMQALLASVKW